MRIIIEFNENESKILEKTDLENIAKNFKNNIKRKFFQEFDNRLIVDAFVEKLKFYPKNYIITNAELRSFKIINENSFKSVFNTCFNSIVDELLQKYNRHFHSFNDGRKNGKSYILN